MKERYEEKREKNVSNFSAPVFKVFDSLLGFTSLSSERSGRLRTKRLSISEENTQAGQYRLHYLR